MLPIPNSMNYAFRKLVNWHSYIVNFGLLPSPSGYGGLKFRVGNAGDELVVY